jgi:hypothetical protein
MVDEEEVGVSWVNILYQYNKVNMDVTGMLGRWKNTSIKEVQTNSRKSEGKKKQSLHMRYLFQPNSALNFIVKTQSCSSSSSMTI